MTHLWAALFADIWGFILCPACEMPVLNTDEAREEHICQTTEEKRDEPTI